MKYLTKLSVLLIATLVLTLCLFASSAKVSAATLSSGTCGENLTWELDDTGTLTISGFGDMTNYSLPSPPWYRQREFVYRIIIGNSVTSIGEDAFRGCDKITSVTIGSSVTSIGKRAFYCCYGLTTVTIPDSVTSIGSSAFHSCDSLTSVTIPDGVVGIGDEAFSSCDSLTSVTIPKSVISVGARAFAYCDMLTSISVDSRNSKYSNDSCGVLCSKDKRVLIQMPGGYSGQYSIPSSITSIGSYAFLACYGLTSVNVPVSVTEIGEEAFRECTGLKSVIIPDSVTVVDDLAFWGCTSLTSVTIGYGVTNINYMTFAFCTSLTHVTIGNGVSSIGSSAFYNCTSLTSVYITDIAAWCKISFAASSSNPLYYTNNLYLNGELVTDLVIPDSVTSIGNYAFIGCTSLTSVTIGNSVTSIGSSAFEYCKSLTSVTIPDSVTSIGSYAFSSCKSLTSVTIPDSVTSIGDSAFRECTRLTSVNIPNSVTIIGDGAFYDCVCLSSVAIPSSVTSIGRFLFKFCSGLTSVVIPMSVTSIDDYAFDDCVRLKDIYYTGSHAQWVNISVGLQNDTLLSATIYYNAFPDVKSNAWYFNAVKFAVEKGYFSGNGDGTFAPGKNITRQDFVVVLSRIAGANLSQYSGKMSFTDVPANAYYAKAIHWATDNGIISGYNATKFGVGDPLTREQLVTILSRYAQKKGVNVNPTADALNKMNSYSDANKINPYMKNAIAWALQNKVINGMTDTTIVPQGNATRAQVAAILMNINAYKVIPGI